MATIVILKKTGEEKKIDVMETASSIYLLISGEDGLGYGPPKKFVDSILLTLKTGKKLGMNPRFMAYYYD